ncbi:MAG: hypothetical protein JWN72_2552 [Thermoleophilia bacterium]|nr:hypothetical protein [Thermoleophilia bacterium]
MPLRLRARTFPLLLLLACALGALVPPLVHADDMDHSGHVAPVAPGAGDARFLPGTVGPVVFRGTAATVTVPDGPGFGGEKGRTQNSGDLRKNNYSVTDANFNNVLGLLPRNPDTGAALTYVQHIQLYAAAGYIEAFAPETYAHMVMHQDKGQGTVLGAAGYLLGLLRTPDGAAHGLSSTSIPQTVPGTTMAALNYVGSARDATGQQWARPHHAQTAPAVYRMLTAAGLTSSAALVLASDDGISGAGRLNGMNEQDGSASGLNAGERATWAFAAQLQLQTGVPVIMHLVHGHDHAGLDPSALTKPKINALIGMAADDRSASDARLAAIYESLKDGRVATAATAAADQNLTVRDTRYLRPLSTLKVSTSMTGDSAQPVGATQVITVKVTNEGPHPVRAVELSLTPSPGVQVQSIAAPAGVSCPTLQACSLGDVSAETSRERVIPVTVRYVSAGSASVAARVTTSSAVTSSNMVSTRTLTSRAVTKAAAGFAAKSFGIVTRTSCGALLKKACVQARKSSTTVIATATPSHEPSSRNRRQVQVVYQQSVGRAWKTRRTTTVTVDTRGNARVTLKAGKLASGKWRVQTVAKQTSLLGSASSAYRYLVIR